MKTTAIHQMTAEHRHIETVIKSLQDAVGAIANARRLNVEKLREAVEFLRIYADERHHAREEAMFFPILVRRGVPGQGCPLGGLKHDHEKGRALVSALEERITLYGQGTPGAEQALRQALEEVMKLYRHHLWMEDAMVFPMAEKLVSEEDNRELLIRFGDLDRAIGDERIRRLEAFAESLSLQAGTALAG